MMWVDISLTVTVDQTQKYLKENWACLVKRNFR